LKFLIALVAALCSFAFAAQIATAGTVHVATTGADSGTCGASGTPCLTIAQATTNAVTGDTVAIGTGTFLQTASINPGAKSLEYVGAGPAATIVSGGGSTSFATSGIFAFRTAGATVAVRDLGITGLPGIAPTGTRIGIWVQPNPANPASAINATVENVNVVGLGAVVAGVSENALYAANNNGSVTVQDSTITGVMGNSLLFENQRGAVDVNSNTITKPLANTGAVIYDMLHMIGAVAYDQTGLHSFTENSISAAAGVSVIGGFTPTNTLGASAFPIGVTISGNTIDTSSSTSTAIALINAANDNTGTTGRIDNAVISGNTLVAGTGGGPGIALQGGIPSPVISGNNLRNRSDAIRLTRRTQTASPFTTWDHKPTNATVSANQLVDNTNGVSTDTGVSVTANLNGNWWGCNAGPDVAVSPTAGDCDTVSTFDPSTITLANWVTLRIAADPASTLPGNAAATVTTGFDQLNTGAASPSVFADGTLIALSGTGGSLAPASPALASSVAASTFTSNAATGRSASATFDHQTVTHTWDDSTAPPVVTISPPASGLIITGNSMILTYTVASQNGDVTCTPPSGSSIPLAVGANTIVVTCSDSFGNTASASITVFHPDTLPACARDVVITSVYRTGSATRIRGIARLKFAGQRVSIQYQPSGAKIIAKPLVAANGSFSVNVSRPAKPAYTSNQARYRAVLGSQKTSWIKLTRRMGSSAVSDAGNGRLQVNGSASLPLAKGQPLRVERSDACGNYRQIGSLRVRSNGDFSGTVASGGASQTAVFIRLKLRVAKASNPNSRFTTYSIVQPVVVGG
jgi:hypothetical protein